MTKGAEFCTVPSMSQARLVLWIALVLASADALPTPRLPWPIRRQGPVGPDRVDDGGILRSLRGGAPRVQAAAMVGASIGTMAHLHRFVRQWASAAGLLASLCFAYPHLPRDFSSCWYDDVNVILTLTPFHTLPLFRLLLLLVLSKNACDFACSG